MLETKPALLLLGTPNTTSMYNKLQVEQCSSDEIFYLSCNHQKHVSGTNRFLNPNTHFAMTHPPTQIQIGAVFPSVCVCQHSHGQTV